VLVVDDEPLLARALQRLLREHEVVVCTNGRQALDHIVVGERFDAILSDVAMPGMSGCELYEEIRRRAPEQSDRFVFLTGDSDERRNKGFLASYGRPVLDKPFDPRALRAYIDKLVE
jgi:CheY-like chemotaxis protein